MLDDLLDRFDQSRGRPGRQSDPGARRGLRGLVRRLLGDHDDDRDRRDAPRRPSGRDDDDHGSYRTRTDRRRDWDDEDDDEFDGDDRRRDRRRSGFDPD